MQTIHLTHFSWLTEITREWTGPLFLALIAERLMSLENGLVHLCFVSYSTLDGRNPCLSDMLKQQNRFHYLNLQKHNNTTCTYIDLIKTMVLRHPARLNLKLI